MQLINKITALAKLKKTFFTVADLKKAFGLKRESLKKAIGRMAKQGFIIRLARNTYILPGQEIDAKKIASQIYAPYAYISFESALSTYGIISQIPYAITMASYKTTRRMPFLESRITIRKIKKELFFGYKLENDILIAEPEKALLDMLYIKLKGIAELKEEDLTLNGLSRKRLVKMSQAYPLNVRNKAKRLAERIK